MNISAVLVTRGDVDLREAIVPIEIANIAEEVLVWDNSQERHDRGVYGRYLCARWRAQFDLIYFQDDDCRLPIASLHALCDAWEPGALVANMPERFRHDFYQEHCLVGFGALAEVSLIEAAFDACPAERFHELASPLGYSDPAFFDRVCDIVFTTLVPRRILVDVPYDDLPWAHADNRMWKQGNHVGERRAALAVARAVRDRDTSPL